MKKIGLLFIVLLTLNFSANAQLADGSIAPDFTLTDRDGNEHHLYQYLNEGKVVFIKFFACHCPSCWNYHNTGKLEQLHQTYGPDGTDQIIVLMLEHDQYNPDAFSGNGGYTQGDWEAGNTIPMVDVEGNDRTVFDDYNLNYYPMIMKVCSDKTVELMSTGYTVQELFDEADDCAGTLDIDVDKVDGTVSLDLINQQIALRGFDEVVNIVVYNISGQKVLSQAKNVDNVIDVSLLNDGLYIIQFEHSKGLTSEKIIIQ